MLFPHLHSVISISHSNPISPSFFSISPSVICRLLTISGDHTYLYSHNLLLLHENVKDEERQVTHEIFELSQEEELRRIRKIEETMQKDASNPTLSLGVKEKIDGKSTTK